MTRRAGGALGDHGGFGQSVSQAEVTREGWSTETGSSASREFCWGRKKAHEERVAGPARWQVLPRASGARLVEHEWPDTGFDAVPCVALEGKGDSTLPCPDCAKHR